MCAAFVGERAAVASKENIDSASLRLLTSSSFAECDPVCEAVGSHIAWW